MGNKKVDFSAVAEKTGKNAMQFFGKAKQAIVNVADQNNDGALDLKDAAVIASAIGNVAKNTASAMKNAVEEKSRERERDLLHPIFESDISNAEFLISKLIRITEIGKKYAESEVCQDAVGFVVNQKDLRIVNIFRDKVGAFGITLHPNADCEVYYVDPCDRDRYIALDGYFNYLKVAYVNELQKIAQDLGAKHFRVVYKEKETTVSGQEEKVKGSLKMFGKSVSGEKGHNAVSNAVSTVEVAAEMDCPGHEPIEPTLVYFRNDPSIKNLISMRMDETSPLLRQKLKIQFSDFSGMKESDAIKIDAALKTMKIAGNTAVVNEVRNESSKFFEYEIDFR